MIGYYASVKDGPRTGFLLGPFDTHTQALDCVPIAKATAEANNSRAVFYAYGTCKIDLTQDGPLTELPAGVLNEIVKNGEGVIA